MTRLTMYRQHSGCNVLGISVCGTTATVIDSIKIQKLCHKIASCSINNNRRTSAHGCAASSRPSFLFLFFPIHNKNIFACWLCRAMNMSCNSSLVIHIFSSCFFFFCCCCFSSVLLHLTKCQSDIQNKWLDGGNSNIKAGAASATGIYSIWRRERNRFYYLYLCPDLFSGLAIE